MGCSKSLANMCRLNWVVNRTCEELMNVGKTTEISNKSPAIKKIKSVDISRHHWEPTDQNGIGLERQESLSASREQLMQYMAERIVEHKVAWLAER